MEGMQERPFARVEPEESTRMPRRLRATLSAAFPCCRTNHWENHDDLPILLAGRGAGKLKPGRHVRFRQGTPLNNLFLSMLDKVGVDVEQLGDSTGKLQGLL